MVVVLILKTEDSKKNHLKDWNNELASLYSDNYSVARASNGRKVKLGILAVTNKETSRMMDGSIPQLCQPVLIIKISR